MEEYRHDEILTYEQINDIAKFYLRSIGGHWDYESGVHEDDVDEFAKDIERLVFKEIQQKGYKIVKGGE